MTMFDLNASNLDMSATLAFLFEYDGKGISFLEEETYILDAFNPGEDLYRYELEPDIQDEALISRWAEDKFPLKVYIGPDYGILFTPAELKQITQIVHHALSLIEAIDPIHFQFMCVGEEHLADIMIKCRRSEGPPNTHLRPKTGLEKQITHANLTLNIGREIIPNKILQDIMHNHQHALGLFGHSNNPEDAAYKHWSPKQQILSPRDVKTLTLLYRCPIAMSRKDLRLLWDAYLSEFIVLSSNGTLEAILSNRPELINQKTRNLPLTSNTGLSQRELGLQETVKNYIRHLRTA